MLTFTNLLFEKFFFFEILETKVSDEPFSVDMTRKEKPSVEGNAPAVISPAPQDEGRYVCFMNLMIC